MRLKNSKGSIAADSIAMMIMVLLVMGSVVVYAQAFSVHTKTIKYSREAERTKEFIQLFKMDAHSAYDTSCADDGSSITFYCFGETEFTYEIKDSVLYRNGIQICRAGNESCFDYADNECYASIKTANGYKSEVTAYTNEYQEQ